MAIYDNVNGLESFILKLIRILQQLHACTLDEPAVQSPPATLLSHLQHQNLCKWNFTIFPMRSVSGIYRTICASTVVLTDISYLDALSVLHIQW